MPQSGEEFLEVVSKQSVDVIMDGSVGQLVPQERVRERDAEQTVAFPFLQVNKESWR